MMGVLMFLLVILKVLGAAETCSCTSSPYCRCVGQGLTSIPPDLPTSIIGLNLGQNLITTLSQSDFSEYRNLETLELPQNRISVINSQPFYHLSSLTNLYLNNNRITALSPDMFTGLGNLERLELESNKIIDIQAKTFSSTPNLVRLTLFSNNLIRLRVDMFTGLGNLQGLYLNNNNITDIQTGTLNPTPELRYLDLNNNQIHSIPSNLLANLLQLTELRLNENDIKIFPFEDLSKIQRISLLYLNNNQMTTLPSLAYEILSSISTVNIDNYPWQCDCRMVDFKLKMTEPRSFDKQITCSQPDSLSGQNLIKVNPGDLMTDCQKPNITRFERIENYLLIQGETLRLVCEASGIPTPDITVRLPSGLEFNATVYYCQLEG
ncbi:PREDICTED: slit homolog 1 protein-like [Branchiostoma belcheri]|uniref:Slit homolog 1 protein-like n=1 Tax=Branchiostoma belcheri TaxID=7741 RepID=A0A6P4YXE0_BRABE|nr:PREDICTED: slit homolog 1 protein-like [Branchiostoma belcheri]